eukprot:304102-Chlamydomonas_euryale.AAC.1
MRRPHPSSTSHCSDRLVARLLVPHTCPPHLCAGRRRRAVEPGHLQHPDRRALQERGVGGGGCAAGRHGAPGQRQRRGTCGQCGQCGQCGTWPLGVTLRGRGGGAIARLDGTQQKS